MMSTLSWEVSDVADQKATPVEQDADYLERATKFINDAAKMDNVPILYMVAAAFKNEDRAKRAEATIQQLREELRAMAADRNLWRDEHNGDCPNLIMLEERTAELKAVVQRGEEHTHYARFKREAASQARHDGQLEKEQGRWQDAIYKLLVKECGDSIDGGGCDSGDPLDFTLSEVGQGLGILQEQIAALEAEKAPEFNAEVLQVAWLRYSKWFGEDPHGTLPQLRAMLEFLPKVNSK